MLLLNMQNCFVTVVDDSLADSVSMAFSTPDMDNDNNKAPKKATVL